MITALLAEEITPKLDTLQNECCAFMQYQKATAEHERLTQILRTRIRMDGLSCQGFTKGGPDRRAGAGQCASAP